MKNNANKYFRLYGACIPVKGAARSTICDLQRGECRLITNSLYEVLTEHRDHTLAQMLEIYPEDQRTLLDYFDFLEREELGFWTSAPERFPPMDLYWDSPGIITSAIIDHDAFSVHDYKDIFFQLEELGCTEIQIRFFCTIENDLLQNILAFTTNSRTRSVHLVFPYDEEKTGQWCADFCARHARVHNMLVTAAPASHVFSVKNNRGKIMAQVAFITETIDSDQHCGVHSLYHFSTDYKTFTEANHFNTCLNKKLGIDVHGNIKNCPSLKQSFGNVKEVSLCAAVQQKNFKQLWEINKDQVEICRHCEFRYICTDCRAFITDESNIYSKPSKCAYDPFTALWAGQEI